MILLLFVRLIRMNKENTTMKEMLYSIPVNDAFQVECECPICAMRKVLEDNAVRYTMGPSYMEEDTRAMTDAMGFCQKHIKDVYNMENRLGMALVLKTNFDKVIRDVKSMSVKPIKPKSLFKKETQKIPIVEYVENLNNTCFVCNRIELVFNRYIDTVIFLWKTDDNFKKKFDGCKGFCTTHYAIMIKEASDKLKGDDLMIFIDILNNRYIANMERVRDDLEWFINKNDYKYANEPWKNAKDAIPRALTKANSIL